MSLIHQPHDRFFKASLKERPIALDFFKAHLPLALYQKLELKSLQLIDKSFVSPQLREVCSDIVYACPIEGKAGYLPILFLVEHQSTPDQHMAFRLLEYTVYLMRDHLKAQHDKLPLVLPLCVYHGAQSPYPYSTDIYEAFEDPSLARSLVFKPFHLIDLTILPLEALKQHGVVSLMEISLQQSFKRAFLQAFQQLAKAGLLRQVIRQTTEPYLTAVLEYVLAQEESDQQYAADELIQLFLEALPEKREVVMTFAQQLENRGLEKGLQQGFLQGIEKGKLEGKLEEKLETARAMLQAGANLKFIKQVTKLKDKDLSDLADE
jgi:predicted transposase/invertase (TIGR01784 family)